MILASPDVPEWIASHEAGLIAAWTLELQAALSWEQPLAKALAGEHHAAMLTTLLRNGTEREFVASVEHSNAGLEPLAERAVADRFYSVSLQLARAATRTEREGRSRLTLPFLRADVLTDGRELPGSEALSGIILPWDHPFWREWLPPLHPDDIRATYRCLTRGQLERSGESVTTEDELEWRKARLTVQWPKAFTQLRDFRRIADAPEALPATKLRPKQRRDILGMF